MFDNKEIAKRALLRAEEIKAAKRRERTRLKSTILVGVYAASIIFVILAFPVNKIPDGNILIDDEPIPLFVPLLSDENAKPYTETESGNNPSFMIPGYENVTIPAGALDAKMVLLNPPGNPYGFTFEIVLDETGETLYKSGLVAPSMCIENIVLSRAFTQGEYKATLIISTYETDSFIATNIANVGLNFIVR